MYMIKITINLYSNIYNVEISEYDTLKKLRREARKKCTQKK